MTTTANTPPAVDPEPSTPPKVWLVLGFVAIVMIVIVGAVVLGVPTADLPAITLAISTIVGAATAAYRAIAGHRSDS